MDTIQAIRTRRTVRSYLPQPISKETLETLLMAAFQTPSAFDERPWHFLVVDQPERLTNLADEMEHCDMLREAQAGFLICIDPSLEKVPGFAIQDCSACGENVLLAAHAMGIGACWIGLHPVEERERALHKVCRIPESLIPFALISLGYPNEDLPAIDRTDPTRVHWNEW